LTHDIRPALASILAALALGGGAWADEVGYQDLLLRLGAAAPTGAQVPVCQVEAGSGAYAPNQAAPEFAGKTFTLLSGASSVSSHATEVGRTWYGTSFGMAPGTSSIACFEAANFVQSGYLKLGQGTAVAPAAPPNNARVFNHSWIGSFGSNGTDNEALRRADFAMRRDHTLMICGENNGAGSAMQALMSMCFNGLAVGLTSGGHSAGETPIGIDGPGRQKPEIVAPGEYTSFSTPVVSAAASLLYETALQPPLDADIWARRGVVIKAALLAGATHRPTWANDAPQTGPNRGIATKPLDPVYGVDTVNINRSHLVLTAGRTNLSSTFAGAATAGPQGWAQASWPTNSAGVGYFIRFYLPTKANTLSVVATWYRAVATTQFPASGTVPKLANLDITLHRVVNDTLVPMTGSGGVALFGSGNCVSRSADNNVEHIFLRNLEWGEYALEIRRQDAELVPADTAIAWFVDPGPRVGDFNGDGKVNGSDLGQLLALWGLPGATDLNGDGVTSGLDLGILMSLWSE
jgi:hypothetical protein